MLECTGGAVCTSMGCTWVDGSICHLPAKGGPAQRGGWRTWKHWKTRRPSGLSQCLQRCSTPCRSFMYLRQMWGK